MIVGAFRSLLQMYQTELPSNTEVFGRNFGYSDPECVFVAIPLFVNLYFYQTHVGKSSINLFHTLWMAHKTKQITRVSYHDIDSLPCSFSPTVLALLGCPASSV